MVDMLNRFGNILYCFDRENGVKVFGSQSSSVAAFTRESIVLTRSSPLSSHPAVFKALIKSGNNAAAIESSISKDSVAPQIPVRRILALSKTSRAICGSADA